MIKLHKILYSIFLYTATEEILEKFLAHGRINEKNSFNHFGFIECKPINTNINLHITYFSVSQSFFFSTTYSISQP